jgi:hypothetical protein
VDFWNSVEGENFSELVFTSAEFYGIPCAKFCGILKEIMALLYFIYVHGDLEPWKHGEVETWRQ